MTQGEWPPRSAEGGSLLLRAGLAAAVFAALVALTVIAPSFFAPERRGWTVETGIDVAKLASAITELDVRRARELADDYQGRALSIEQSSALGVQRARLSLYVGDCDSAGAILDALDPEDEGVQHLARVAEGCAGAVAGSLIVEDAERGIWLRLQDAADEPLAPYVAEVAARALESVRRDLGVVLPRPLRIDVVRDLFSLSAVSGLPLEAAETTGTVAVARWGRITLLSPRASRRGYPWEDTMAHEIVHLALSRATRDFAPLWLQEGVAKRQELRWRSARPFDDPDAHHREARRARAEQRSVGVQNLGPSIAMLPSAKLAATAFSEVTSFITYWIETNGTAAFRLLLADLKGLADRDPNRALTGVTGYDLDAWETRWNEQLDSAAQPSTDEAVEHDAERLRAMRVSSRAWRLGDLMMVGQHFDAAHQYYQQAASAAPRFSAMRYRAGLGALATEGEQRLASALGSFSDVQRPHAGWLALVARQARAEGHASQAAAVSRMAVGMDPWSELVACEGHAGALHGSAPVRLFRPADEMQRRLCEGARARPPIR